MSLFSYRVHGAFAIVLNSHMWAEDRTAPINAPVCINNKKSRKILRCYSEVVNYLLITFATYQSVAEYDAAILCCTQPANMASQQYAKDLVAKFCKVFEVY